MSGFLNKQAGSSSVYSSVETPAVENRQVFTQVLHLGTALQQL